MNTEQLARAMRRRMVQMVHRAKASHIASALSIVDMLAVLYGHHLRIHPTDPGHPQRDRLILSKGHGCVAVYAVLAQCGFIDDAALDTYGDDFSPLMNHISHKVPGVEFSTGSLGHGLSFGVGKALGARHWQASWGTYVILGDGEMAEGANWEALLFAAHHRLANLTAIIDCNNMQSLTTVDATLRLEPLADKLASFGCDVAEVDGHDHQALRQSLEAPRRDRPRAIIARTTKGKGVSFMEHSVAWHYRNPNDEELARALRELEEH